MTNTGESTGATSVAEWKFYDGSSNQISTSGGTFTWSDPGANAIANSFDNNNTTFSYCNHRATAANPCSLTVQFPSPVTVASISITDRSDGNLGQSPTAMSLLGSTNGTTWTTIGNLCGTVWASASQVQTFPVGAWGLGTGYRLLITATGGFAGSTSIAEWKLFDTGGAPISTPTGAAGATASGGACFASEALTASSSAFDGTTGTYWASVSQPSAGAPQWIAYRFSASKSVGSFSLTARNDSSPTQTPGTFTLQQTTDGVTWTDVKAYTATTWTLGSSQTFTVPQSSGGGLILAELRPQF